MTGEELHKRRKKLGLTQAELGIAIQRPQKTISRWETGNMRIESPGVLRFLLERLADDRAASGNHDHFVESLPTFLSRDRA